MLPSEPCLSQPNSPRPQRQPRWHPANHAFPTQLAPAPTPASVAPAGSPQYEFTYSENSIIGNLGSKMSFVGRFMLGIGLFFFASVIIRWVQSHHLEVALLFLTLLFIVVGIWTHRAGREFRSVAESHGKGISHLMGALENLLKLYTLLYLLFFIGLISPSFSSALMASTAPERQPVGVGQARLGPQVQSQGASGIGSPLSTA